MPHMPKHKTKGQYFTFLEQQYAPGNPFKLTALAGLRDASKNIEDIGSINGKLDGPLESGGSGAIRLKRRNHLRKDWFGFAIGGGGKPPELPAHGHFPPATGWWIAWQGEPEKTLRCTLIRALEISMGLTHSCPHHVLKPTTDAAADPAHKARDWPIQFFWVCGPSKFEGYVSWKTFTAGPPSTGVVEVILVTPGFDVPIEESDPGNLANLDLWVTGDPEGTIFVGQDDDITKSTASFAYMVPNQVVTHRMETERGGSGVWHYPDP